MMGFFETPLGRLRLVQATAMFAMAFVLLVFFALVKTDAMGKCIVLGLTGFCAALGVFNLWRARRTLPKATVTIAPGRAPLPAQVRHCRRMLWVSATVFPLAVAMMALNLNQLESGKVKQAGLWEPFATIYRYYGYWPALGSMALLGVVCCLLFALKLKSLSRNKST